MNNLARAMEIAVAAQGAAGQVGGGLYISPII
jgi:hypothetical protein